MNRLQVVFQANLLSARETAIVRAHLTPKHHHRPYLLRSLLHEMVCAGERLGESVVLIVQTHQLASCLEIIRLDCVQSSVGAFLAKTDRLSATTRALAA